MAMKQQVVTLIVAYDEDYVQMPSEWDWDYESDTSHKCKVIESKEPTDFDPQHPRWRMSAERVS